MHGGCYAVGALIASADQDRTPGINQQWDMLGRACEANWKPGEVLRMWDLRVLSDMIF
jgi:hypothetical protein